MRTSPLLCLSVLLLGGCLDWSSVPPLDDAGDDMRNDAGQPAQDGGVKLDADADGSCPEPGDCDAKCGTVAVDGCPPYQCEPCGDASVCKAEVSCVSIGAECGVVDNGCQTETCVDLCQGMPCVDFHCCEPESITDTCAGSCGGTRTNRCGQEIDCEAPCGIASSGCTESGASTAAVCNCPHGDQGDTCEQWQFDLLDPIDIVVDAERGFDYVLEGSRDAVLRLHRATGARIVFSDDNDDGVPRGLGPGLVRPEALLLDASHRRLFVSDSRRHAILEVDLDNGDRETLSDDEDAGRAYGTGPALGTPRGMALDLPRNRLLVTDFVSSVGSLYAVDLTTGDRTLVSSAGLDGAVVGTGPRFSTPQRVAIDPAQGTAYVFGGSSLVSVDLANGNRTLVSTGLPPVSEQDPTRGIGPDYAAGSGILQLAQGRALVFDSTRQRMVGIDLTTGDRSIVTGLDADRNLVGEGPMFRTHWGMFLEPDGIHVLCPADDEAGVFRVDTQTGNRSVVYDSNVGTGPALEIQRSFDARLAEDVAYVANRTKGIMSVDLTTGARSMILPMERLGDAALDASGEVAYVLELEGIVRVVLATGERTVISSNADPQHNTHALVMDTPYMLLDPEHTRLLMVQNDASSVVAVDLSSGRRRLVSGTARGTGPAIGSPSGAVLDPTHTRLFVSPHSWNRILSVDLETGNRTIVSGTSADGTSTIGEGPTISGPMGITLSAEPGGLYVTNGDLFHVDVASGNRTAISVLATGLGATSMPDLRLYGGGGLALDEEHGFLYTGDGLIGRFELATGNRRIISRSLY